VKAEGEGGEGFYIAQSDRCPDLLVIWGGRDQAVSYARPAPPSSILFYKLRRWCLLAWMVKRLPIRVALK
jgi:hypothetical protein